jgi:hypothetical protein
MFIFSKDFFDREKIMKQISDLLVASPEKMLLASQVRKALVF